MTVATAQRVRPTRSPWTVLAVGVLAASLSPIFIRYAEDAPALAVSLYRCVLGALLLLPFAWKRLRQMTARDFLFPGVAGAFLAIHFASWITSLHLTSVAASVVLVSTTPIFVAGASRVLFGDRLSPLGWSGIVLGLAGTALISGGSTGGSSLRGDLLALTGGAMAAGYFLSTQRARRTLGIMEYAVATYGTAAIILAVMCAIGRVELTGYDGQTWWAIAAIVLIPQLLGHTLINVVLKDIDATTVAMTVMVEPVLATVLAFFLFSETPAALVYPGGVAVLVGIYLVTTLKREIPVVVE
ncbi:MAG: DMT family transporter [Actinomycetota bacterium]|nr:DMT family transporter [Actinomycetota bacterium]